MPKTLHAELAARSDADGVSLNQYIVSALARAVSTEERPVDATQQQQRRDRSLRTALVVNAVVVGLAAVTAIVLLILALR